MLKLSKQSVELSMITGLFFMWGFMTALNDILIPHLKALFDLNYLQAMLVQFCFFAAYFVASVPSGKLIENMGYRKGITVGLMVCGGGCLLFYPAAAWRSYPLFLAGFFVLAAGIALLQVAANALVTLLGNAETAASRLTLTQAFNSLGTTIAPYIGALLILATPVKSLEEVGALSPLELTAYRLQQAADVQMPYLALAAAFIGVACLFGLGNIADMPKASDDSGSGASARTEHGSVWQFRHLLLGALAIFTYVGAEVAIGSFLVNYLALPRVSGLDEQTAGKFVSLYWGGAMLGRFLGAAVMKIISPNRLLAFNALMAAALLGVAIISGGKVAIWCVLSIGFFNSIMFPTLFALSLHGLGEFSAQGSGVLCMAIVGGAIIPLLQGAIADIVGIELAFILPMLCYGYIVFYGLAGYRPISKELAFNAK